MPNKNNYTREKPDQTSFVEKHKNLLYALLLLGSFTSGYEMYHSPQSRDYPPSFRRFALTIYSLLVIIAALGLGTSAVRTINNCQRSPRFFSLSNDRNDGSDEDSDVENQKKNPTQNKRT